MSGLVLRGWELYVLVARTGVRLSAETVRARAREMAIVMNFILIFFFSVMTVVFLSRNVCNERGNE